MTSLTTYEGGAPHGPRRTTDDFAAMVAIMAAAGVTLERWDASAPLSDTAGDDDIAAAYAAQITALKARGGYQSHDIIHMRPDHPARDGMRAKFRNEHVHDDDEVRFFVRGSGLFYIHHGDVVHALECTAGDLIVLPAGIRHWFDMGDAPAFTAIRLFISPDGWEAQYTGDDIAAGIPAYAGPVS